LAHWRKLGKFRKNHPCYRRWVHQQITATPYLFTRTLTKGDFTDKVLIGLDLPVGKNNLMSQPFSDGTKLKDSYSGTITVVKKDK
jgi:alpha-amylase